MLGNTLKNRFKRLDLKKKMILIGSFVAFIGVFLPWYKDIDKFKTGDMFLGITGPLYLAGIFVLLAAAASFGIILMELLEKPKPKLPLKDNHFFIFGATLSLLMIVIASSVYFHTKFGINLTDKSMGIGMIMALIGSGLTLVGGIVLMRKGEFKLEDEGEIKPLIDLNVEERVQSNLEEVEEETPEPTEVERPAAVQGSIADYSEEKNTNDLT